MGPSPKDNAMIDEYLQHDREKSQEAHQDMAKRESMKVHVGRCGDVVYQKDASGQRGEAIEQIGPGSVGHPLQPAQQLNQAKCKNKDCQDLMLEDLWTREAFHEP